MNGLIETNVIGKNIRFLRLVNGMTQQALADEFACDIRQIRRYENGTNSIAIVNEFAKIFQIPAVDLMTIDMEKVNYNPVALGTGF